MAYEFYLTAEGKKSGNIKGSCTQAEHRDEILCYGLKHELYLPTDPNNHKPVGNRRHGPFAVIKAFDSSSPIFAKAVSSGESLDVKTTWWRANEQGTLEHYYTIELTDARVVRVEPFTEITLDERYERYGHMEQVSFVYRRIKWIWVPSGVETYDDWEQ